jgi:SnoaL-like domain
MPRMTIATRMVIALLVLIAGTGKHGVALAAARLSAMDYVEIQQLVNRLNFALDYCGNGGRDFAALFTADGEYVVDEAGQLRTFRGPEQLAGLAGGPDCAVTRTVPRLYLSHLAESLVIEPAGRGARGTSYAIYPGRNGRMFQADVAGQVGLYHDEFVRTAKGWRLQRRRHEVAPEVPVAK